MSYDKAKFINFDDFYKNRKLIRMEYKELSLHDKIIFKRYLYDEVKERESDKDVIWNFLNENPFCNKDLRERITTRKMRKGRVHNLYDMVDESFKLKEIEKSRADVFNLFEQDDLQKKI